MLTRNHCLIIVGIIFAASHRIDAQVTARIELVPFTAAENTAFVKAHNEARKAVSVELLEWSDDLAAFAAEWLKAQTDTMKGQTQQGQLPSPGHRPYEGPMKQKYGESVASWGGSPNRAALPPEQAVRYWLTEKEAFEKLNKVKPYVVGDEQGQLDANGRPIIVGHYTQVVWKQSQKVGAARAMIEVTDASGRITQRYVAIVANYDPPGNLRGEKAY